MLSLSNVGNGQVAASYYESADDYYTSGHSPSRWWGDGAAHLGLQGGVDAKVFAELLDGQLPTGEMLHHAASGRRGGTDGTFSAPKSVSMQALVGGDRRIIEAHHLAVERALAYAQTLAACRVTADGIARNEATGNLVVACFAHDLSRACDPQLHTHCVMVNATRRSDGQWRAMDNQQIYRNKMLLGALYRAELARELQGLGYGIRLTHDDGRFELAHITEHQVKAFSQRSNAIEAYLKEHHGLERAEASAWDKKLIAVITRDKKTAVDRAYLRDEWQSLSEQNGIDYKGTTVPAHDMCRDLNELLDQALRHIGERQAAFSQQTLMQAMLERCVGTANLAEIEVALQDAVKCRRLIRDGNKLTTPAAQQIERAILDIEARGRGKLSAIYTGERHALRENLAHLSDGQCEAALGILLTHNQVIGIQGRAGVGKTTLLQVAAQEVRAQGYTVKGLAPSASAARELIGAGIEAETLAAFMHRENKGLHDKTLLIVDEAGMASSRQLHAVLDAVEKTGCRVVLVGDTAQLQAVEAGKPFAQLQAHGMHTAVVGQIQRQKNPLLKKAVELAVDGQVAMAVEVLDKHILQIAQANERFECIANDYINLPVKERVLTRVIAGTRSARNEINQRIHDKLGLKGQRQEVTILERKDHTEMQARSILSYQVGDVVLADSDYPSLCLKRGESATVVERLDSALVIERADGGRSMWQPALVTKLSGYVPVKRSLVVGDKVRITANDRTRGLINGDLAEVVAMDSKLHSLTLSMEDGRQVSLDSRRPMILDYGYCSTVYGSQGQTCDRIMIEADGHSTTANENMFYVAISRARYTVKIYTDDRELLPLAMSREIEKEAALDVRVACLEI
ncbi:MobF family relaxase [Sapientia aquatica]|nr:MobF family relaxase [Sapientia aquatica]